VRHDSQPRRRSLRVQYRCTGSMMTTRASESGRAIRHTDRRAAARHRKFATRAPSLISAAHYDYDMDTRDGTRLQHMESKRRLQQQRESNRRGASTQRARRGHSATGAEEEASPYGEQETRRQRHGITGRSATARTARGGYIDMGIKGLAH
jgi:hypothetical protein